MKTKTKRTNRSKSINTSNCHEKLDRIQIRDGVVLMLNKFDMAGSAGPFDIYELNVAYIMDLEKRDAINAIIGVR